MRMSDTGFDSLGDVMQKTENRSQLYASLYAHDANLARLIACWPNLTAADRAAIAESAVQLSADNQAKAEEMVDVC